LAGNGRGEYHLAIRALSMTGVPKGKAQDRLAQADSSGVIGSNVHISEALEKA
jgi:hypothetical protein